MSIAQRLQRLEAKLWEKRSWLTVFKLEDGSTFTTEDDPITFLIRRGVDTPKGRIADYVLPEKDYDPLSLAIMGYIRELISRGTPIHPESIRDQ